MVEPENEPEDLNAGEQEPEGESVRPTQDDLQRQLEEVRREAAMFREQAARGEEWQKLARQVVEQSARPVEVAPEPEPELDVDPTVRAYLDRKLQAYMGEIGGIYQRDRQQDLQYRASLERERAATRLVGFNDLAPEIEQVMNTLPPEVRATPGAFEEAYYLTLGRKAAEMLRVGGQKPVGVATSTRVSGGGGGPVGTLSAEERALLHRKFGGRVDEEDVSFFTGNREVSIEDFNAYSAKRAKGGRRK